MNSIFIRLYGGMLGALLLVGALFYATLEVTNHHRAQQYREDLARGPFLLLAEAAARHKGDERERWLSRASRMVGSPIELVEASGTGLRRDKLARLEARQVLVELYKSDYADVFVKVPDEPLYLRARLHKVAEQQARAAATLVLEELARNPVDDWDASLRRLRGFFGFDLQRMPPQGLSLDTEQQERVLERQEIILVLDDRTASSSTLRVVAFLPQTGEILVLGPLTLFDWFPYELLLLTSLFAISMMGLAAYLLVRPLENRLKEVERAVTQIRAGDLGARAKVAGNDAVGQLAHTMNGMADHIQRLLGAQKEMVRAVSHELRTPVARIRFGLDLLRDAEDDEARERQFDGLDGDIEELDKLIDEILTYSRLEEGQPKLNFKLIDIDALLRRIKRETDALGTGITVDYESPNIPLERRLAEGEERYIHRVVQNFVGNALRYANGRVRISFGMVGDIFRIDVEDDGPGVPKEDRERVFQPFTRLDDSRTRASGGYGLGLSIVQRIAYWHGGKARVSASNLGGAKFTIIWPRSQALRELREAKRGPLDLLDTGS